jgi:hypothetical protein
MKASGWKAMVAWGVIACGGAVAQDLPRNKVLILGIDGAMPTALAAADTPTLDALIAGGAFSDRAITHPVTHSAACWSSMFTGVWGDKHGVNDPGNSFAGNHFDQYPNFLKRLELSDSSLSTVAFLRWAPLAAVLDGVDRVEAFGSDADLVAAAVDELTQSDPDVLYAILLDVDSAGHNDGWGSDVPGYIAALETADARVGEVFAALTNRPTYQAENWLVFVLSDQRWRRRSTREAPISCCRAGSAAPAPRMTRPGWMPNSWMAPARSSASPRWAGYPRSNAGTSPDCGSGGCTSWSGRPICSAGTP